jgi:hypothetical protein
MGRVTASPSLDRSVRSDAPPSDHADAMARSRRDQGLPVTPSDELLRDLVALVGAPPVEPVTASPSRWSPAA